MQARPVLMLTHDDLLWQQWKKVSVSAWLPARGRSWADVSRWHAQGRRLVVVDAGLPDMPRTSSQAWADAASDMELLIASMKVSDDECRQLLAAGAKGYVHAYITPEGLESALNVVNNGGVWLGASLMSRLLKQLDKGSSRNDGAAQRGEAGSAAGAADWAQGLTPREREVAVRVAKGYANQEIADALGISERTVRAHISSVFDKLAVPDRLMLALVVHGITV